MNPGDSKNVHGSPKLQSSNFTLKLQGCSQFFRMTLFLCNLGFPYTFSESPGSIASGSGQHYIKPSYYYEFNAQYGVVFFLSFSSSGIGLLYALCMFEG